MAESIDLAVILAAGQGLRLRRGEQDYLKPLYPLCGKPLIGYVMEALVRAGVRDLYVVVGFQRQELVRGLQPAVPTGLALHVVDNPRWELSNGVSLLAARGHVGRRFFLSMADHVFDEQILTLLLQGATDPESLYLAVDHKLETIFDMDDAMKVRLDGDHIADIHKELQRFDAVDTGLFVCPPALFEHLERARTGGDCSLADGVRAMASRRRARVVDIGGCRWQDVDTQAMLEEAERLVRGRSG